MDWTSNGMIALYIAAGLVAAAVGVWLVVRRTIRTRLTEREVRDDPDIHDWLVIFDWSRKVLYLPTMAVSLVAAALMGLHQVGLLPGERAPVVIGGAWFAVFLVNFFVEEFEVSLKVVLLGAAGILALFLWLHLLEWVRPFLGLFRRISIAMSAAGYVAVAVLGGLTLVISWVRGLFYYLVFTPNYMNIQWGPTESGDHIAREDYNTHVDTSDILERLMGFGRIIIIFKDQKRPPITFLVWRIGKRAKALESVRGKFAIDTTAEPSASGAPNLTGG
jgi:hypothetical protein